MHRSAETPRLAPRVPRRTSIALVEHVLGDDPLLAFVELDVVHFALGAVFGRELDVVVAGFDAVQIELRAGRDHVVRLAAKLIGSPALLIRRRNVQVMDGRFRLIDDLQLQRVGRARDAHGQYGGTNNDGFHGSSPRFQMVWVVDSYTRPPASRSEPEQRVREPTICMPNARTSAP